MQSFKKSNNNHIPDELKNTVAEDILATDEIYLNDIYQVNKRILPMIDGSDDIKFNVIHLSIKRIDRKPISNWRHKQEIKNEFAGPETTGLEFYPPESKLVDTSNQYHLFILPIGFDNNFPFIFQYRLVSEDESFGQTQEPFENKPKDLLTKEDLKKKLQPNG